MKDKYISLYRTAVDKDGKPHVVTIVAKLKRERYWVYDDVESNILDNGGHSVIIRTPRKSIKKSVVFGVSICHPDDKFDEKVGIGIAKKRIKDGRAIGTVYTHDVTMLTKDAIECLISVKLKHICENIDKYVAFFAM